MSIKKMVRMFCLVILAQYLLCLVTLALGQEMSFSGNIKAGDGAVGAPSLGFGSDPDTGIFTPSGDTIAIALGNNEYLRLIFDSTNSRLRGGIGTGGPGALLDIQGINMDPGTGDADTVLNVKGGQGGNRTSGTPGVGGQVMIEGGLGGSSDLVNAPAGAGGGITIKSGNGGPHDSGAGTRNGGNGGAVIVQTGGGGACGANGAASAGDIELTPGAGSGSYFGIRGNIYLAKNGGKIGINTTTIGGADTLTVGSGAHLTANGAWTDYSSNDSKRAIVEVQPTGTWSMPGASDLVPPAQRMRRGAWELLDQMTPIDFEYKILEQRIVTRDGRTLTPALAFAEIQNRTAQGNDGVTTRPMTLDDITSATYCVRVDAGSGEAHRGFIAENLPAELSRGHSISTMDIAANNTGALKEAKRRILAMEAKRAFSSSESSINGDNSIVTGGSGNIIDANNAAVIAGYLNSVFAPDSVIVGGTGNQIGGSKSVVLGGQNNRVDGDMSLVTGENNQSSAPRTFVGGRNASLTANARNTFVWSNAPTTTTLDTSNAVLLFPAGEEGAVAIGTALVEAGVKLKVQGGDIRLSGGSIIIDGHALSVPDYVFEPGHKKMSAEELRAYVAKNKHLPNMPSGQEFRTKGLDVKDIQMKMLENIEELTVTTLEQDQVIKEMKARIEALESEKTSAGSGPPRTDSAAQR